MAEPDVKPPEGGGIKEALTRKIGPLPAGVWIVIAVAVFYYVSQRNKAGSAGGGQTDPAGNVGTIDPKTGYVYGTAEDAAALGSGSSSLGGSSDSGTGGSTVAGQYADNNAWAIAAINYLVSIGVDATEANTAITQFLASQQLTTQQQADVNLVIQRLGAPPSPPEPGGNTTPIVNPPSGGTYAANPPTGFTTTTVSANAIGAKWNAATNATSYTMSWGTTPNATDGTTTVSTTAATATGLKPNTLYYLRVQASPAKSGAGFASLSKTTAKASSGGGGSTKPPSGGSKGGGSSAPFEHTVTHDGESYSSIAAEYHYKPGGVALWRYNITSSPHSAEAKAKLKRQGADLLYHGQIVYIPRS
jgi:hypothetical protein